ncbi:MAG: hypothetical protein ABSC42_12360 [Tepidisphaeraceae bacterium]|jgi:hypothetical protein
MPKSVVSRLAIVGILMISAAAVVIAAFSLLETPTGDNNQPQTSPQSATAQPGPWRGPNYTAELSSNVPHEFSGGRLRVTPQGNRRYIGPFGPKGVVFTLTDLPAHAFVHVTFDLLLLNSWNGCSPTWGPDIWACKLDDGPELLRTTFCNCGFFSDNNEQNYPDLYPTPDGEPPHDAWTGAAEHGTLGDMHSWGGPDRTFDCSTIYRMDWIFPHADSTLKLDFTSKPIKRDKVFGFLSFHVETLAAAVPLTDDQLKQAWNDLGSDDAVAANSAVWRLIASGDSATQMFAAKDLAKLNGYPLSRVRRVLQVVNTPAARDLSGRLP